MQAIHTTGTTPATQVGRLGGIVFSTVFLAVWALLATVIALS